MINLRKKETQKREKPYPQVGARLRRIRKEMGYPSTEDIAKELGVSPGSISRWECGEEPGFVFLKFFHDHGYSLDWILSGKGLKSTEEDKIESIISAISELSGPESAAFFKRMNMV